MIKSLIKMIHLTLKAKKMKSKAKRKSRKIPKMPLMIPPIFKISSTIISSLISSLSKNLNFRIFSFKSTQKFDIIVTYSSTNSLLFLTKSLKSVIFPFQFVPISQSSISTNLFLNNWKLLIDNSMS